MEKLNTRGIILSRINYGEADRIISVLTPESGKLSLIAKGSRKVKSKLAGGIELFSISDISYIKGKREIGTLISSRLVHHFGNIINDIDRVQLGYELTGRLNKVTEDKPEVEYYQLLSALYESLDDLAIDINLIYGWFNAQLMKIAGYSPNLSTDINDDKLIENLNYSFDYNLMSFEENIKGIYNTRHIKAIRLLFSDIGPQKIASILNINTAVNETVPLINNMLNLYILIR